MSWIIVNKDEEHGTVYLGIVTETTTWPIIGWANRDGAKRFETKADAKTVQDKYNLGGSIIPA